MLKKSAFYNFVLAIKEFHNSNILKSVNSNGFIGMLPFLSLILKNYKRNLITRNLQ